MTLRFRLGIGLLAIAILLVIPVLLAVGSLRQLHRNARDLRDGEFAASLLLGRLRDGLNNLRQQEMRLLFVPDREARDAMERAVTDVSALSDSLDQYELHFSARGVRSAVAEIAKWGPEEYRAALTERTEVADSISSKHFAPALANAERAVHAAENELLARTRDRVNDNATAIRQAEVLAMVALLLALAVAGGVAIVLTRAISRPVVELERGMSAVAEGDFDHRMALSSKRGDEFGRLACSFEVMTQQLAELDRIKAEFVSVASHELKTPINVVVGYIGLLQEGVYGRLTEQQMEVLRTLEVQTQALGRLVKQLLDVSRFEAGGSRLDPRPVNLPHFLQEMERGFHVLAVQRGVRFLVTPHEGLQDQVVWDQDRMSEVLGNLLSNAFKFTPRGGEVELSAAAVADGVQMEVRDTGAGIPEEQLPHIFDKFFQASNQGAAATGGTGLGLAIAKQIVEAHRGTIQCDSTPGVGTTFTITMPSQVHRRASSPHQLLAVGAT